MSEILNVENLHKNFDGVALVKDVSFAVRKQSIVLITGENGAGKTTLFNLITGLEKPTKGKINFNGNHIEAKSALQISQLGIIRLYQQPRLFKNLLVWENLVSAAHNNLENRWLNIIFSYKILTNEIKNLNQKAIKFFKTYNFKENKATKQKVIDFLKILRQDAIDLLISFDLKEDEKLKLKANALLTKFGLQDLSNQTAGELSYGQQKLISFCMIAMNGTQLALLDEPFAGLNPKTIEQFSKMILQMRKEGITFLIIEHNINKGLAVADSHIEMKDGNIYTINNKSTV